jgi:phosphatidylethanolamine/phosphatidyl-N-methylethanolamine N-methyltransferase
MDGHKLEFEDNSFDCIILNLILTVITDPKRCIAESERILKPGGKVVVFDKFLGEGKYPSALRKLVNAISGFLFSEINRRFSDILAESNLKVEIVQPSLFGGLFKIFRLRKLNYN